MEMELGVLGSQAARLIHEGNGRSPLRSENMVLKKQSKAIVTKLRRNINKYSKMKNSVEQQQFQNMHGTQDITEE